MIVRQDGGTQGRYDVVLWFQIGTPGLNATQQQHNGTYHERLRPVCYIDRPLEVKRHSDSRGCGMSGGETTPGRAACTHPKSL